MNLRELYYISWCFSVFMAELLQKESFYERL